MSTISRGAEGAERIRQVHKACFEANFYAEYYRELHVRTSDYARHFDFVIGLGTALTGGTGLGILADPLFAWVCGAVTAGALILSVAKSTYNWAGKMETAADLMASYTQVAAGLGRLVDDLNADRTWSAEFNKRFVELRDKLDGIPPDRYKQLPEPVRDRVQDKVLRSSGYSSWWRPYDDDDRERKRTVPEAATS